MESEMGYLDRIDASSLVGETLTYIDIDPENNVILLTTESGKRIKIYHDQDCSETVEIVDTDGNWHDLIGKPIVLAEHEAQQDGDPQPSEWADSWTRTTLTFKVDGSTVISRWIGKSNG